MLKHTRFGQPHLRQFQLSADRKRLLWYSASKGVGEAVVHIADVRGICIGQHSPTFQLPALRHLSFSLVLGEEEQSEFESEEARSGGSSFAEEGTAFNAVVLPGPISSDVRTLDLTCKDEGEFDVWVCGIKALVAAHKKVLLSKTDLLSHSRRFRSGGVAGRYSTKR